VSAPLSDAIAFVSAIHAGNYDTAAVFADWLDEHGDGRGQLLRRRWKRWQKERIAGEGEDRRICRGIIDRWNNWIEELSGSGITVDAKTVVRYTTNADRAGTRFCWYLQKRFPLPEFAHVKRPHR
jgi:uncharacterized protein (TIGR02996 family)